MVYWFLFLLLLLLIKPKQNDYFLLVWPIRESAVGTINFPVHILDFPGKRDRQQSQ